MEGIGWLGALASGALVGFIAALVKEARTGMTADIILGTVGAIALNGAVLAAIGYTYGWIGQIIVGAIGAAVAVVLYRAFAGRN